VQKAEYTFTGDKRESVTIVNKHTCTSVEDERGSRTACKGTATINGKPA
jgi:hypothetical protein